jgi:arginyl-tRNA synthetase
MVLHDVKKAITRALREFGIESPDVSFEHPDDLSHGDYSTNVALRYAKELKTKPAALANAVVEKLKVESVKFIEKTEIAGAGFINFHLSKEFFADSVKEVNEDFGKNNTRAGKKVMVEYTDPNPFKEFHIGHLMSNAVGEAIARLYEYQSAKVVRACWQGDVGLHVAKAIWGARQKLKVESLKLGGWNSKKWGEAYALGSEKFETDEAAKKEITALNKTIYEKSDAEVNKLYDAGRKTSLAHFEEIYKVLGTKFDHYFFEGIEGREGVPIVEKGLKDGVFERSEGAIVYKGEKKGLHTRVFLTKENLPTYEAKELGLNKAKFEKEPDLDESLIVTASEQSEYFKVVLAAMAEVLPEVAKHTRHVAHGMLRFASGKMSSRKGNIITGEGLINQVEALVHEKIKEREMTEEQKKELAEIVAVGAIKYSILRQAIGGDIIFDFDKSISFEGDSGPYLQYSYVRAKSVLQKATQVLDVLDVEDVVSERLKQLQQLKHIQPSTLERLLYRFPEVVEQAGEELEPHHIATFLIELAGAFNSWYASEQIVDTKDPTSPYKVALTEAFAMAMKNGLWLLGIKVPEKM